jgi:hypothetical protein
VSIARYYTLKLRARILAGDEPAWLQRHIRRGYIIRCCLSFVPWADRKKLRAMARSAHRRGLVLDHVIPVTHPDVCGLTVPENMQMITSKANAAKSNKWNPDQLPLIGEVEQRPQMRLTI